MSKDSMCACCGEEPVEKFDICDICGWQSDPIQNSDPNYKGGANEISLNQAKRQWKERIL